MNDSPSGRELGSLLRGVPATRHSAWESGACALPSSNYAVVNPVAPGNVQALKHLNRSQSEL